jgi:hypothetical protein
MPAINQQPRRLKAQWTIEEEDWTGENPDQNFITVIDDVFGKGYYEHCQQEIIKSLIVPKQLLCEEIPPTIPRKIINAVTELEID